MNMLRPIDQSLKVYYHAASLGVFAAQEIAANDGIRIRVRHPATVSMKQDGTGFEFNPVIFIKNEMDFFVTAFMGEAEMPENMRGDYLTYVRHRENNLPN